MWKLFHLDLFVSKIQLITTGLYGNQNSILQFSNLQHILEVSAPRDGYLHFFGNDFEFVYLVDFHRIIFKFSVVIQLLLNMLLDACIGFHDSCSLHRSHIQSKRSNNNFTIFILQDCAIERNVIDVVVLES